MAPESKIQLVSFKLSPKYILGIYAKSGSGVGRHTCHRRVYPLWLAFICTVFRRLIYFRSSVRTNFRIFCVPVNFLIQSVRFQNICNKIILLSTSEAHIWFLAVTFSTLIIRVPWIEGWFIMALILYFLIKEFFSCVWTSTVTAPWLRKNSSLWISYWIVQI